MAKKDYSALADSVIELVGGKSNISFATHCMTRLRLNLKDRALAKEDEIKNIPGILGAQWFGDQFQIIVGQDVPKLYAEVCNKTGLAVQEAINENLDGPKEKLTLKKIGSNIMGYLSGSMVTIIPGMMGVAFFKMFQALLGPTMLGIISEGGNFYVFCDIMYNAFFYFIPVFLGWSAAKKLGCNPILGMMTGTMLLVPTFTAMIGSETVFSVYGIPAPVADYGQTIVPVLLSVWILSYIERFFQKIIPNVIAVFVPFLSLAVLAPINFCLIAPLGARLGEVVSMGLIAFGEIGGPFASAVVGGVWMFLVMTGMHQVLIMFGISSLMTLGFDAFMMPASGPSGWAVYGLALGAFLRLKKKEDKVVALSSFASGMLSGISEPTLYGIGMRYRRPLIAMAVGGFVGGLYAGLTHVIVYPSGGAGFLSLLLFAPGGTVNMINGTISSLLAFVIAAVGTYMFGFSKEELSN